MEENKVATPERYQLFIERLIREDLAEREMNLLAAHDYPADELRDYEDDVNFAYAALRYWLNSKEPK